MGNCLGLCDLVASPDRLRGLQRIRAPLLQNESSRKGCIADDHSDRKLVQAPLQLLDERTDEVGLHYELCQELGRGEFGVIRLCKSKKTGEHFACKSIAKRRLYGQKEVEAVRREIQVMKLLKGHPKVVEMKAVFEDETCLHLVMELCEGGDLFDRISGHEPHSEKQAAEICKSLIEAVQYWQTYGIIHRDLKPENILLVSKCYPSEIKVADFGLAAANISPGEKISGMAGSAYYIAPEVLRGEYGMEVDVWSCGVILYILLCGLPPFWSFTEEGIYDAIKYGRLDLYSDPWPSISPAAKDLVRGMLCPIIKKRFAPEQILSHEWIVSNTQPSKQSCSNSEQHRLPYNTPWNSYPSSSASSSSCSFLSVDCSSFASSTCMSLANSSGNSPTTAHNERQSSLTLPLQRYKIDDPEPLPCSFEGILYFEARTAVMELVDRMQLELSGSTCSLFRRCDMHFVPNILCQFQAIRTGRHYTLIQATSAKETAIIDLGREKSVIAINRWEKFWLQWKRAKDEEEEEEEEEVSTPLQNQTSFCYAPVCVSTQRKVLPHLSTLPFQLPFQC